MTHRITLVEGDGIGPEVTSAVVRILEAAGLRAEWEPHLAGVRAIEPHGSPLPVELLDSIKRTKVALKGPVTTPVGGGFTSVNVGLRKALGLFANLRPVWNIPSVPSRYENIDIVIVRENTEDLYSGLEHEVVPGVVESLKIITEQASTRIAIFAFEYARTHGRRRVTAVHKANIMKMGDGLFLECVRKVARALSRYHLRRSNRGRRVHAPRDEPGAVRRAPAAEPVRRHRLRSVCRPGGWTGRRSGGESGRGDWRIRGRARQRARHRRQRPCEPDRAPAVGAAHAAAHRRGPDGRSHHEGRRRDAGRRRGPHPRSGRHGHDGAVRRRHLPRL